MVRYCALPTHCRRVNSKHLTLVQVCTQVHKILPQLIRPSTPACTVYVVEGKISVLKVTGTEHEWIAHGLGPLLILFPFHKIQLLLKSLPSMLSQSPALFSPNIHLPFTPSSPIPALSSHFFFHFFFLFFQSVCLLSSSYESEVSHEKCLLMTVCSHITQAQWKELTYVQDALVLDIVYKASSTIFHT